MTTPERISPPQRHTPDLPPPASPERNNHNNDRSRLRRSPPPLLRPPGDPQCAQEQCPLAMSRAETILISSAGDVLVCRCPNSAYPQYHGAGAEADYPMEACQNDVAVICCDVGCDDLSMQAQDANLCSPWSPGPSNGGGGGRYNNNSHLKGSPPSPTRSRGGLLGGAPAQVGAAPLPLMETTPAALRGGGAASKSDEDDDNSKPAGDGIYPADSASASTQPAGPTLRDRAHLAFRSPPISHIDSDYDEKSIVPIRSFDYSHFQDGGNDMLPEPRSGNSAASSSQRMPLAIVSENGGRQRYQNDGRLSPRSQAALSAEPPFAHGIPSFLPAFGQIKVTQVSAHPLGAHVLLISDAGLLYSYGLNDYGQLGIGLTTSVSGFHRGFVMTPTIVTPLIENGGKAIACAAGISHSLVVVATEERRLVRTQSSTDLPPSPSSPRINGYHHEGSGTESIIHHQIYGFGRNDYMKIGLVSPKLNKMAKKSSVDMDVVKLPRRVALRCKVKPDHANMRGGLGQDDPPFGIFAIAASAEHSAALVRRSSGDVELYTWGSAMYGSLGLPQHPAGLGSLPGQINMSPAVRVAPVPSFVAYLSRTSNPDVQVSSLLSRDMGEYPARLALGRRCSFVTTSQGRCFSFGTSKEGMLGHGPGITEVHKPREIRWPRQDSASSSFPYHEPVRSISAGATHALAMTPSGNVYGWGHRLPAGLAQSLKFDDSSLPRSTASLSKRGRDANADIAWTPELVDTSTMASSSAGENRADRHRNQPPPPHIVEACAGNDSSLLVTKTGHVFSCGKKSGRLGLGEQNEHVQAPKPLFGGLRLWYTAEQEGEDDNGTAPSPTPTATTGMPPKPYQLRRGNTVS